MALHIITDSTCDLSPEETGRMNIDVLPLKLIFDGEEYADGTGMGRREFYDRLREAKTLPTTSQVNPEAFLALFERYRKQGDEVVVLTLSSEISGTYQSAVIARQMAGEEGIFLIDSHSATFGMALLLTEMVRLRDQGATAQEIASAAEELKGRVKFYAMVDTLKYLKMGGRLPAATAVIGGLLGVKPIVSLVDGKLEAVAKTRGSAAAFQWMLDQYRACPADPHYPIAVAHADSPEGLAQFKKLLTAEGLMGRTPSRWRWAPSSAPTPAPARWALPTSPGDPPPNTYQKTLAPIGGRGLFFASILILKTLPSGGFEPAHHRQVFQQHLEPLGVVFQQTVGHILAR